MSVSLVSVGLPAGLTNIIQQNFLLREFREALLPLLLFRAEAMPERWEANIGERAIYTRTGLIEPTIDALAPGKDPEPGGYGTEQWAVEAAQYGKTILTHMPSSAVAIASLFLENGKKLGIHAGQSMGRLARNKLYRAYHEGEAMCRVAVGTGVLQIKVSTINGFTERVVNGALVPVSSANPIPVTFTGTEPANNVVAAVPDDPARPFGQGTITLATVTTVGVAAREGIKSAYRSVRLRVGGGATVDALTTSSILTVSDILAGVTRLRDQNVPPHPDGTYHVHFTPQSQQQIYADNAWQRIYQQMPDRPENMRYVINEQFGCKFYLNNETPRPETVVAGQLQTNPGGAGLAKTSPEVGAELTNASGVRINRVIMTGGGALVEKYLDESRYITEAGVLGKIGSFSVTNQGVAIMTDRIRYIIKAPQDDLQQVVKQVWSWSGDFGVPSDVTTGDAARYKRSVVIEHG